MLKVLSYRCECQFEQIWRTVIRNRDLIFDGSDSCVDFLCNRCNGARHSITDHKSKKYVFMMLIAGWTCSCRCCVTEIFQQLFRSSDAPWYAWIGGICGGYYVIINVLTVPRLGAATVLSIFVCAQVSSAVFSVAINGKHCATVSNRIINNNMLINVIIDYLCGNN